MSGTVHVKRGEQRVHTSNKGMIASDGTRSVTLDENGRVLKYD